MILTLENRPDSGYFRFNGFCVVAEHIIVLHRANSPVT